MATRYSIEEWDRRSQFLTDSFQRGLAHWNRERLQPRLPDTDWNMLLDRDTRMLRL
ncbi:MAG: iron-containing redox enzyme family protein, partial [Rhizorhabdus sp.]